MTTLSISKSRRFCIISWDACNRVTLMSHHLYCPMNLYARLQKISSQFQFEFKLSIFNGICITWLIDNSNISGYFEYFSSFPVWLLTATMPVLHNSTPAKYFLAVVRHCIFDMLWQMKEPVFYVNYHYTFIWPLKCSMPIVVSLSRK